MKQDLVDKDLEDPTIVFLQAFYKLTETILTAANVYH